MLEAPWAFTCPVMTTVLARPAEDQPVRVTRCFSMALVTVKLTTARARLQLSVRAARRTVRWPARRLVDRLRQSIAALLVVLIRIVLPTCLLLTAGLATYQRTGDWRPGLPLGRVKSAPTTVWLVRAAASAAGRGVAAARTRPAALSPTRVLLLMTRSRVGLEGELVRGCGAATRILAVKIDLWSHGVEGDPSHVCPPDGRVADLAATDAVQGFRRTVPRPRLEALPSSWKKVGPS
ncbi:hypothetical protein GCM10009599_17350 [Luteococcus peritonei]